MSSASRMKVGFAITVVSLPFMALAAEPANNETTAVALDLYGDALPHRAALRLGTTRLHHHSSLHATAFSPDGRLLASAASSQDTAIALWEVPSGRFVRYFTAPPVDNHWPWTECVAFSPDGKTLASGDMRGRLHLWNIADGHELYSIAAYANYPGTTAVAFSCDGRWIATGGGDGAVRVWSTEGGHELLSFDTVPKPDEQMLAGGFMGKFPCGSIADLTFSPDGRFLAAGIAERRMYSTKSGLIRVWDLETNQPAHSIDESKAMLTSLAYTPDGKQLVVGGNVTIASDKYGKPYHALSVHVSRLQVWDAARGTLLREIATPEKEAGYGALTLSRDGRTLAAGYEDKIMIWDFDSGTVRRSIDVSQWAYGNRGLALSPDGRIVAAPLNGSVGLWYTDTGELLAPSTESHTSFINSVAYSAIGDFIVTAGDSTVRVWDAATGRQRWAQAIGNHGYVAALALSRDGSFIAAGGQTEHGEGGVLIWQAATGELVRFIPMFEKRFYVKRVRALALSADSRLLAIAHDRVKPTNVDDVDVFSIATGEKRVAIACGSFQGNCALTFSPDASKLYTLSGKSIVGVWDVATGEQKRNFTALKPAPDVPGEKPQKPWIASGVFSSDAKTLITSQGRELVVWDVDRGEATAAIPSQGTDKGGHVALSHDGRLLAMSDLLYVGDPGADAIRLFDLQEKRLVATLESGQGRPSVFAFSPDATRLVTGMSDGTALVWDVSGETSK